MLAVRIVILAAALAFCGEAGEPRELVLASTTSTEDSGLFDVLLPAFRHAHPLYNVKMVAVGSGEAMTLGRRGDADVLLVHAPAAESAFMEAGHGVIRRPVMKNDFVIAGPGSDPAGVRRANGAVDALRRVATTRSRFISRGDSSGTHQKEVELWSEVGLDPSRRTLDWYTEAGQGMGDVLRIANERRAYVLTDRATFLSFGGGLDLDTLFEGDESLRNPYSVITVAGARNEPGAQTFADWIASPAARTLIAGFGVERFGRALFIPVP